MSITFTAYENGLNEMIEGLVAGKVLREEATEKTLIAHLMFDRGNGKGGFRSVAAKRAAVREFDNLLAMATGSRVARGLHMHFVGIKV